MCDLLTPHVGSKAFTGYKLVAKGINGRHYSIAMGFCYDNHEDIPVVKQQRRISSFFKKSILSQDYLMFRAEMVGRTAVFKYKRHALDVFDEMDGLFLKGIRVHGTTVFAKVVKATVSKDLMDGRYGADPVVAGRRIEFK